MLTRRNDYNFEDKTYYDNCNLILLWAKVALNIIIISTLDSTNKR